MDFRIPDYTLSSAFVMGSEEFGVSEEARTLVDQEITIPMVGMARSLNVSVATAVLLFEAQRQRQAAGQPGPESLDLSPWEELAEGWIQRDLDRYWKDGFPVSGFRFPVSGFRFPVSGGWWRRYWIVRLRPSP